MTGEQAATWGDWYSYQLAQPALHHTGTSRNWCSSRLLGPMVACQASRRPVSAHLIGSQALWLQSHCQNKWSSERMAFFLTKADQRGCATIESRFCKWAFSHRFPATQTPLAIYKSYRLSMYGLARHHWFTVAMLLRHSAETFSSAAVLNLTCEFYVIGGAVNGQLPWRSGGGHRGCVRASLTWDCRGFMMWCRTAYCILFYLNLRVLKSSRVVQSQWLW